MRRREGAGSCDVESQSFFWGSGMTELVTTRCGGSSGDREFSCGAKRAFVSFLSLDRRVAAGLRRGFKVEEKLITGDFASAFRDVQAVLGMLCALPSENTGQPTMGDTKWRPK